MVSLPSNATDRSSSYRINVLFGIEVGFSRTRVLKLFEEIVNLATNWLIALPISCKVYNFLNPISSPNNFQIYKLFEKQPLLQYQQ